jgi:hypothetical protein
MCSLKSEGTVKRKNGRLIFDDCGRNPIQHRGSLFAAPALTVNQRTPPPPIAGCPINFVSLCVRGFWNTFYLLWASELDLFSLLNSTSLCPTSLEGRARIQLSSFDNAPATYKSFQTTNSIRRHTRAGKVLDLLSNTSRCLTS